jgi:hypothetical protein
MNFRDMSFCSSNCTNTQCYRHYGPDDEDAAKRWWGKDNPPVAFMDFSGACPDYKAPDVAEGGVG